VITKTLTHLNRQAPFQMVLGLWLLYAGLTMFAPSANTYHLSWLQLRLVQLTIVLPILVIWLTAIYGAVRFMQYAQLIRKSADGQALRQLTEGLILLAFSFVIQGVLGLLPRYLAGQDGVWPLVFIYNHLPMVLSIVSLWYIYKGSVALSDLVGAKINSRQVQFAIVPFVLLALVFAWYFYAHLATVTINGIPNFALPGKWPFFTLALPYLAAWILGLLAILNITNYIVVVKGPIYKLALRYLAAGIMAVLTFSIFSQFITLSSSFFAHLSLMPILLIIYLILLFYALGFVLIAIGARKLTRIEGV
jgi:hypothetical protein